MQLELHQQKVLEFLLKKEYHKERVEKVGGAIATLRERPENWYNWLYSKGFISKEHLDVQLSLLNKE